MRIICFQDFGIWERGDKTNHGVPEINATSIGMARVSGMLYVIVQVNLLFVTDNFIIISGLQWVLS